MSFISPTYALLLLATVATYWLLGRSPQLKLAIVLVISLFFYASLQVQYLPLLVLMSLLNFWFGKAIAKLYVEDQQPKTEKKRLKAKNIALLGITINVFLLITFKYIPFILHSLADLLNLPTINQSANLISDRLLAPLGISFFTFECIAYLIDVYRGAPASQQWLDFTSYKLFFPKLISGPITRYHYFQAQITHLKFPAADQLTEGLWLIACGAVKKALVADKLGVYVDIAFGNLERAGSGDLWLATLAYGLQLYFDFSGYVDMARGSALLLGFNLPENFNFPYFSTSIADFWRRWHITLGDWLRNYLYFPLGGSRQGLSKTCLNLIIVMLIAGIWHGAAWGYVVWGAIHGVALAIHRLTEVISQQWRWLSRSWQSWWGIIFAWLLTQLMVFFSWIFFRLPTLPKASLVVQHLFNYVGDIQFRQKVYAEGIGLQRYELLWLIVLLLVLMNLEYLLQYRLKLQLNWPIKLLLVPLFIWSVWQLVSEGGLPYIYFDF